MQADALTQIILPIVLFIIMLGMGLSLRLLDFTQVFKAPKAVVLGLTSQLVMLPILGLLVITVFQLQGELAVGLLIITLCPGGTTSNMISYLARGDVALSIGLTAIVSVLTPFTIPLFAGFGISYFMGDAQIFELPLISTIIQLLVITIVPVAIGMFIHYKKPAWSARLEKPMKILSVVFLVLIILGIVLKNKESMVGFFVDAGVATLVLNILAIATGFGIAIFFRLSRAQAITLGIEVGIQNGTVALLIAGTILQNPVMTIPAVTYSLLMFVTGGVFGWMVSYFQGRSSS